MDKSSFLATKVEFPKNYKGVGILRVLWSDSVGKFDPCSKREMFIKNIHSIFIIFLLQKAVYI